MLRSWVPMMTESAAVARGSDIVVMRIPLSLVPRLCRRLAKLADRHNDAQPFIGAFVIPFVAHLLHHLARLRYGLLTIKLDEEMR